VTPADFALLVAPPVVLLAGLAQVALGYDNRLAAALVAAAYRVARRPAVRRVSGWILLPEPTRFGRITLRIMVAGRFPEGSRLALLGSFVEVFEPDCHARIARGRASADDYQLANETIRRAAAAYRRLTAPGTRRVRTRWSAIRRPAFQQARARSSRRAAPGRRRGSRRVTSSSRGDPPGGDPPDDDVGHLLGHHLGHHLLGGGA
jgi:hypothetical protein